MGTLVEEPTPPNVTCDESPEGENSSNTNIMDSSTSSFEIVPEPSDHPVQSKRSGDTEGLLDTEQRSRTETEPKIKVSTGAGNPKMNHEEAEFLDMYRSLLSFIYPEGISHSTTKEVHDYILRQGGQSSPMRQDDTRKLSLLLQAYFRLTDERLSSSRESWKHRTHQPLHDYQMQLMLLEQQNKRRLRMARLEHIREPELTIPTLNRVAWPNFKRKYKMPRDSSKEYTIDILLGDPAISYNVWKEKLARSLPKHLEQIEVLPSSTGHEDPAKVTTRKDHETQKTILFLNEHYRISQDFYTPMPDRIRINGTSLILLLQDSLEMGSTLSAPSVLLKPFKLLVRYESHIRGLHCQLRRKFEDKLPPPCDHQNNTDDTDHSEDSNILRDKSRNPLVAYSTEQAYKELSCLVEFMDNDLKVLRYLNAGTVSRIYFSDLWHIFKPGEEVITSQQPYQAYRILHVTGGRPYLSPPVEEDEEENTTWAASYRVPEQSSAFVVSCYHVGFDGIRFGPVAQSFDIQGYSGIRDITSLPIYPLKFAKSPERIRETLLENGNAFMQLLHGGHRQYSGPNLHEAEEIDSPVIIDFHAALWNSQDKDTNWDFKVDFGLHSPPNANRAEVQMMSAGGCSIADCCENDRVFDDLDLDSGNLRDLITDKTLLTKDVHYLTNDPSQIPKEDLILLPHRLPAFVLKDSKWAVVDINHVKEVEQFDGWPSLVLPKGHKNMIYSLIQAHYQSQRRPDTNKNTQVDLVHRKGKGLIILLDGTPGVGKTFTAECVADFCKQPLYPVNCGDLGTTSEEVESRLKRIFIQAQKWRCILLLSEADIFLDARENSVKHKNLVSVFLRVLESYQGIIFLTANCVRRVDEAFKLRAHITLNYPPLDENSTLQIFKHNLERTKLRKEGRLRVKEEEILEFASNHYRDEDRRGRWNGRQIRDAFHIAIALAENEAQERDGIAMKMNGQKTEAVLCARHFDLVESVV
ncbi:hypothetical protein F4680DRAFT_412744 [Xylaria scruposa]|nr:hypothetical protein F4680DRAFT_412744 [Xylaria scruposa]